MVIEYETCKYISEQRKIEIEDPKNVFLEGRNIYDNLPTYFGIWLNDGRLSIVTIISYRTISYKSYLNPNLSTKCDIQEYLKNSKDVRVIGKSEFKEQIKHITTILKI